MEVQKGKQPLTKVHEEGHKGKIPRDPEILKATERYLSHVCTIKKKKKKDIMWSNLENAEPLNSLYVSSPEKVVLKLKGRIKSIKRELKSKTVKGMSVNTGSY